MDGSLNKYAGSYEMRASSIYGPTWLPYKLFDNSNTFNSATVEYPAWSSGSISSNAYKPITNESLTYSTTPYNSTTGSYQGGGNASTIFTTTYYTTGSTTLSRSGEWVQINVPYNMKLISYSNLTRYKYARLPVQYVILGSNDGSTWYLLDDIDIGSWVNYIPLKKYNINTTTYPYAANYYSYFRYVISKLDTKPNSGDRIITNEGQWCLVGIKQTNLYVGKPINIGANSPTGFTSYFTSNNVTVPSTFSSKEYIGTYTISESSTAIATPSAYNLFLNSSTNDGTSYGVIWHCAYPGNSYINGVAVIYPKAPYIYDVTGDYQGGGSYFTTPFYNTSNSTYTSPGFAGEWVQIKLPFRIKLTGYSHRTRYLNFIRNPDVYNIFGSNDGIIWYVVDKQTTFVTNLNTIVTNTTTNVDAKHGYSYFRWVINSITGGDVANENQWNLIGIRVT
jgi:hypothetical protein